ncbi:ATP-dependent Clp protease ATP-binding subunit [Candidatus Microgenomates bacterium]|nr:ATP-dependent Clp protease ATP-binding subunit [Candidatus Microgenomates bacterium]
MAGQLFNLRRYFSSSTPAPVFSGMEPEKRQDLTLLTHFSQRLNAVISQAANEASLQKQSFIEPEHLLLGLLYDAAIFKLISQLSSASPSIIGQEIRKSQVTGQSLETPQFSSITKEIFEKAAGFAKSRNEEFITPEHVFFAIVALNNSQTASILSQNGITKEIIENKLANESLGHGTTVSSLESYGADLTKKARDNLLDPVIGRDKEIERIVHILVRRTKNNPILVGESGVGKTAIVEGLAQKIVARDIPIDLQNKRIISLDLTSLIAGASHRGEFEERLKQLIKELKIAQGEIILFIDEVHNLVGAGSGEGTLDASNILKPFLARGEVQLIGTSTIDEYRRYIEKDPALERRFQQVLIEEPTIENAILMLNSLRPKYENFHHVKITDEAIAAAVKLSKQYIGDRFLPDKAVDLIDEAASKMRLSKDAGEQNSVSPDTIAEIVAAWTGIPVTKLTETESDRLLHLEALIHQRLINQDGAVSAIAEAVRRGRAGLKNTNRPIGSFLFMGPTGVGKTELAKTLAQVLFGSEILMIRLDMSEYMEKHEVAKLIGAPPGYVGYEEGGQLTEAVRTKPYSVILLDEIEKAHPDVFNILIQILEDGRLTDNKGRTVSFKNTIIIATSNIGTALIQKENLQGLTSQVVGVNNQESQDSSFANIARMLLAELEKFFKPELLNRFDEIIVFKPLAEEHMLKIATIGINNTRHLLLEQKINLEISSLALEQLSRLGFDPVFGARPLRRIIQTRIENPISTLLIKKAFGQGDTIIIDYNGAKNDFSFEKKPVSSVEQVPVQTSSFNPFASNQNSVPL